jgi:hypothetical protein
LKVVSYLNVLRCAICAASLSELLVAGLAANAHADQLVALRTTFGFSSQFQLGSGTINHAKIFPNTVDQQMSTMSFRPQIKKVRTLQPNEVAGFPKLSRICRRPFLQKMGNSPRKVGLGVYPLTIDVASQTEFCDNSSPP